MTEVAPPRKRLLAGWLIFLGIVLSIGVISFIVMNPGIGVIGECSWGTTGQAWLDEDADGVWDATEPPMEGIPFNLEYVTDSQYTPPLYTELTDYHGDVSLRMRVGCGGNERQFVVYPDVPPGYRLTTHESVTFTTKQRDAEAAFGFTYLPGAPTATPRPSEPVCTTYHGTIAGTDLNAGRLFRPTAAPDGTLWFAHYGDCCTTLKMVQYLPASDEWKLHTLPEHPAGDAVLSLQITADNSVWIMVGSGRIAQEGQDADPSDILRYDGTTWEIVTFEGDPYLDDPAWFSIAPDGKFWFLHQAGFSIYDPEVDQWSTIEQPDGTLYSRVVFGPDGLIVTVARNDAEYSLSEYLLLLESPDDEPERFGKVYSSPFIDVVFAPDGSLWVASYDEDLERFDLDTGEVQRFYAETTGGQYRPTYTNDLEFSPDGTLWIAMHGPAIYRYTPPPLGEQIGTWRLFDQRDGIPETFDEETDGNAFRAVVVQGDIVWFREDTVLVRCTFPE